MKKITSQQVIPKKFQKSDVCDLVELLTQTQMDDRIRIVLFTGQGKAFWAGDDLKGYGGESAQVPPIHHGHHNAAGTYLSLIHI